MMLARYSSVMQTDWGEHMFSVVGETGKQFVVRRSTQFI